MESASLRPDRLVELGYAFRGARALMSAVELGVFTALAGSALAGDDLQRRLGLAERGAQDFFDALVALGLLQRDDHGRYSNARDTDLYLDSGKGTYIGGFFENLEAREYDMWRSLTEALRTGKPQTRFEAKEHFRGLYSDPQRLDAFMGGMTGATLPVAQALASRFPWHEYNTLVDVGTAQGCLPAQIALAHPHIKGGGFDLPILKATFDTYMENYGLADRLQFFPGDFHFDPLPATDVLVMGRVLHNWDLTTKQMLLKKAYAAIPPGGALIIYERLIDDRRRASSAGLLSSLNMLIMTAGGFDFTAEDCMGWMREVGFQDMRVEPLVADHSMIVATK